MNNDIIIAILGSSVISVLITQLFTKLDNDKKIRIETITKERKEWRDYIRTLIDEIKLAFDEQNKNKMKKLEYKISVRLNPEDFDDLTILDNFHKLYKKWDDSTLIELVDRISYLLKHDWERVKSETSIKPTISTFLSASIYATISVIIFFYLLEKHIESAITLTCISIYFSAWLVLVSLIAYFFIEITKSHSVTSKKIIYALMGTPVRVKYKSRAARRAANKKLMRDGFQPPHN